jgi:hypothetical protein
LVHERGPFRPLQGTSLTAAIYEVRGISVKL